MSESTQSVATKSFSQEMMQAHYGKLMEGKGGITFIESPVAPMGVFTGKTSSNVKRELVATTTGGICVDATHNVSNQEPSGNDSDNPREEGDSQGFQLPNIQEQSNSGNEEENNEQEEAENTESENNSQSPTEESTTGLKLEMGTMTGGGSREQNHAQPYYVPVVPTPEGSFSFFQNGSNMQSIQHVLVPVEISPQYLASLPPGTFIQQQGFNGSPFGINIGNVSDGDTKSDRKRRRKNRLCESPGCSKNARGRTSYCVRHGGGTRCAIDGCEKGARPHSMYCSAHGGGHRCLFSGCNKGALAKSVYCRRHGKLSQHVVQQGSST